MVKAVESGYFLSKTDGYETVLSVKVGNKNIHEFTELSIEEALDLPLTSRRKMYGLFERLV